LRSRSPASPFLATSPGGGISATPARRSADGEEDAVERLRALGSLRALPALLDLMEKRAEGEHGGTVDRSRLVGPALGRVVGHKLREIDEAIRNYVAL